MSASFDCNTTASVPNIRSQNDYTGNYHKGSTNKKNNTNLISLNFILFIHTDDIESKLFPP